MPTGQLVLNQIADAIFTADAAGRAKFAAGLISATELAAGAVTAGKVAAGGVSAANQFAAGVVDSTALAAAAVTAGKIGAGAIATADLANNAVNAAKLAAAVQSLLADAIYIGTWEEGPSVANPNANNDTTTGAGKTFTSNPTIIVFDANTDGGVPMLLAAAGAASEFDTATGKIGASATPDKSYRLKVLDANGNEIVDTTGNEVWAVFNTDNRATPGAGYPKLHFFSGAFSSAATAYTMAQAYTLIYHRTKLLSTLDRYAIAGGKTFVSKEAAVLAAGQIGTNELADLSVTSGKLAAAAVIAGKIAAGGVSAATQFAAGVVDSAALAAAAVTAGKIATGGVSAAGQFAAGVVDSAALAAAAVTAGKVATGGISAAGQFAAGVVDSAALAAAAVTAGKIGAGGVSASNQFAAGVVDAAAIGSGAVTQAKIAAGAVTNTEVAAGAAIVESKLADLGREGAADLVTNIRRRGEEIGYDTIDAHGFVLGTGDQGKVEQAATPAMSVRVIAANDSWTVYADDGSRRAGAGAGQSVAITAADGTNPRLDVISLNSAGVLVATAGTPAASPTEPALPSGNVKLAVVRVAAGATSVANANISDHRRRAARTPDQESRTTSTATTWVLTRRIHDSRLKGIALYRNGVRLKYAASPTVLDQYKATNESEENGTRITFGAAPVSADEHLADYWY